MPKPGQPEKREWLRVDVNMPARCRAVDGPAKYAPVFIVDMHHHGCCFQGYELFQKGQAVRLVLEIPFEGEISMTGDVAWSGPLNEAGEFRTGLRFRIDDPVAENTCLKLYNFCLLRQPR